jgi:hypothetical protein
MKNKIIILSLLLSFFMVMIPSFSDNVKATSINHIETFQGGIVGNDLLLNQSVNGEVYTHSFTHYTLFNKFYLRNVGHSGTPVKSMGFAGANAGWINESYSKSSYITNFSFWFIRTGGATHQFFYFYNSTIMKTKGITINATVPSGTFISNMICGITINQGNLLYMGSGGSAVLLEASCIGTSWIKLGFEITDDLGSIKYYRETGTTYTNYALVSCINSTQINNNYRIDSMLIYSDDTSYIDDLNYTMSGTYSGGGVSGCGINLDGYDKLGIDNTPNTMDLNYPVFQKINYGLNYGYLAYITLCVNPSMYSIDPNPNNYTLTCMGFSLGGADCFDLDGYNYRLIWEANLDLGDRVEGIPSGKNIDCMFTHASKVGSVAYWQVCIGSTVDTDLDSDGITSFKLWNSGRTVIDYDVGVSFYFDPTTHYASADSIFTDSLGLHNGVKNATGYVYNIDTPEGIICSYLLSQASSQYQCKIVVMKNTTTYYRNLTGLTFPSGVKGVLPDTIGKYTFKLYNYHYIYNITAWVTGVTSGFFISSDPTITNPYETYKIVYRYYHLLGTKGCIGVFDNITKRGSYVYAYSTYDVNANTSSYKLYPSTALSNEYLTLFVNISYKTPCAYAVHYINDNNILENNIYVSPFELGVNKGNPEGYSATIKGTHVFSGCRVSIFINGREMFSVKDEQTFTKTFTPPNPDSYNISLRLYQNGSWVTLKYCQFIASDLGSEGGGGIIPSGWSIDPPFSYFIGVAIIIITTLSPLLVVKGVNRDFDLSSIPQFLYLIMAIVGFVISIIIGFIPAWSILVLVTLGALIIVIMWIKGSSNKTG